MILQQPNSRIQQSNVGCVNGQCGTCAFGLICQKSPYCKISSITTQTGQVDTETLSKVISSNIQHIDAENQQLNNNMVVLNNNIQLIHDIVNKMFQTLTEKVEQMDNELKSEIGNIKEQMDSFSSLESKDSGVIVANEVNDIDSNVTNANTVVPYSQTDETVLVEKKGLFGRSKWVEKKA